jgi:tetratricopeptide (TPR) repeat protein
VAVLWVKADSRESLISGFLTIARLTSLPGADADDQLSVVNAVLQWLKSTSNWLLIFDNADDVDLVEDFIPTKHGGHVLLTSRARVFDKLGIITPIKLETLLPEQAERFLRERVGRDELPVGEHEAVRRLSRELDHLPLALEQAAAYIKKTMCSFEDYLKCYVELGLSLLEKSGAEVGKYEKSIATTWLLNFDHVEQMSHASAELLRASAFLDPDEIPVEMFIDGAKELGPSISAQLSQIDSYPLAFDELVQPISDLSLIRRHLPARTLGIHRLVQAVLRQQLNKEEQILWVERIIRTINEVLPGPNFWERQEFSRFFPHVLKCAEYIDKYSITSEEAQRILLIIGKHFAQRNRLEEAEDYSLRAVAIGENTVDQNQDRMLTSSSINLGTVYFMRGKYSEAESVLLRCNPPLFRTSHK